MCLHKAVDFVRIGVHINILTCIHCECLWDIVSATHVRHVHFGLREAFQELAIGTRLVMRVLCLSVGKCTV